MRETKPVLNTGVPSTGPYIATRFGFQTTAISDKQLRWPLSESVMGQALASGHVDMLTSVLSKGADPNQRLPNGETPLFVACTRAPSSIELGVGACT